MATNTLAPPEAATEPALQVYAAGSLRGAVTAIAKDFEARTGKKVALTLLNALAQQTRGAEGERHLLPGARFVVAGDLGQRVAGGGVVEAHGPQGRTAAAGVAGEREQPVHRLDALGVQVAGLLLGDDDRAAGLVGEAFEHLRRPSCSGRASCGRPAG